MTELYQVFNMGIGMVSIVAADKADAVLKFINAQKHKAWIIGEVVKGKGEARGLILSHRGTDDHRENISTL